MWGPSSLSLPKQPTGFDAQDCGEGLNLVVQYPTVVILDLGDGGSIQLNADPSEFA
jgi:hypothetical protein